MSDVVEINRDGLVLVKLDRFDSDLDVFVTKSTGLRCRWRDTDIWLKGNPINACLLIWFVCLGEDYLLKAEGLVTFI